MEALIEIQDAPLTLTEEQQLAADEAVIERGQQTFIEVGIALTDIRDNRLYRKTHRRFEDYITDRWPHIGGRRRAYLLIDAAAVVANVNHGSQIVPTNERQVRPLSSLAPDQQRSAWQRAVEIAQSSKITSTHVEQAVQEIRQPMAVHYSSATPEWYTPQIIIDRVIEFFDEIDLDPCSNSHASPNVPATEVFTQEDDGLSQVWSGRVYMNPPYGETIGLWVNKIADAYDSGEIEAGIALLPGRVDTRWFRRLRSYAICFLWGRLQFVGAENSAPFPSILVYLGNEVDRFRSVTATIGDVWVCSGVATGKRVIDEVEV